MATYENDSNDSIGSRRRRGAPDVAPPLGPFYGTVGPRSTLATRLDAVGHPVDAEGNAISGREYEDARIFRNGLEYLQVGSTPGDYFPQLGGTRYVANDAEFGFIVPRAVNQSLVNQSNAMHGDAFTRFADGGGVFWTLAGAFAAGVVAPSVMGGLSSFADAAAVPAATTEGATVSIVDDFMSSIGIDPGSEVFSGGGSLDSVAVGIEPGVPPQYEFGNALRDIGIDPDSLQFRGGQGPTGNPWDFSGPAPSTTIQLPTNVPGAGSALSSLVKSVFGGGQPGASTPGSVIRPGANNYVFLPIGAGGVPGAAAGGAYFPNAGAGQNNLVLVLVGVGLVLAFAGMRG